MRWSLALAVLTAFILTAATGQTLTVGPLTGPVTSSEGNVGTLTLPKTTIAFPHGASFVESADQTEVLAGSGGSITDAVGNVWTITGGGQVAVNGAADTVTANVAEIAYVNHTVWQENTSYVWYYKAHPTDTWAPVGSGTLVCPLTACPVISAVASAPTTTTAPVTWTTDKGATSQVFVGLTNAYGSNTTLDSTLVTSHSQTLTALNPATIYHFKVRSAATGHTVDSTDNTFTTGAAAGADYYVDPTAAGGGNGSLATPWNSWTSATWTSGKTYAQKAGTTYTSGITLSTPNVTLTSYGTGAKPIVYGVVFNSSGDTVSGYALTGTADGAAFATSAANNTLDSSDVYSNSGKGVNVNSGAGTGNKVQNSTIHNNGTFGVATYHASSSITALNNEIYDNGYGGVQLEGDNSTIKYNYLHGNATNSGGSSALHTFSGYAGSPSGYGNNNNFSYNIATTEHDFGSSDGNGLQIDQYTHGNTVVGNVTYQNDGAGNCDYDGYNNTFTGNLSFSNQVSTNSIHQYSLAEFYFTSQYPQVNMNYGNTINSNIAKNTHAGAVDLLIDANSQSQTLGVNYWGGTGGTLSDAQLLVQTQAWWNAWKTNGQPQGIIDGAYNIANAMTPGLVK